MTRARYPDVDGFVERDGVRVFWESYGEGPQTVLFLPTWTLAHSRVWKMQIPYFARHFRVICFDPRGNGRSDRPRVASAYDEREFAQDALAVLDACGVERAICVALSRGAQRGLLLAAEHPERVAGLACIGPWFPVSPIRSLHWRALAHPWLRPLATRPTVTARGWGKFNPHHWSNGGYADFVQWWVEKMLCEPHSTKQAEDAIAWAHDTDGLTLAASAMAEPAAPATRRDQMRLAARVRCPVIVIHGTKDTVTPYSDGRALAAVTGGLLETVDGAGHLPQARKPVQVNLALREFVDTCSSPRASLGRVQLSHIRKGSGEPLLLVHGLGSHYKVWQPVIDRLAVEREVVGIDLPGFGDSPPLPDDGTPSAEELTTAVESFLDDIGWDRPHVAGNSLGGWVGLELAKRGRARSVAAIGPAGFANSRERAFTVGSLRAAHRAATLMYGAAPRLVSTAAGRKLMLGQNFARAEVMPPEAAVATLRNFADSPGVPAALEALRQGHFSGGEQIDVPVTMIWGEKERLLPRRERQAARSVQAVPGARLVWLRGCGHAPTWDDPPAVAQAILEACAPSQSPLPSLSSSS